MAEKKRFSLKSIFITILLLAIIFKIVNVEGINLRLGIWVILSLVLIMGIFVIIAKILRYYLKRSPYKQEMKLRKEQEIKEMIEESREKAETVKMKQEDAIAIADAKSLKKKLRPRKKPKKRKPVKPKAKSKKKSVKKKSKKSVKKKISKK